MRRLRRGIAALAVGAVLLLVPDSQTAPTLFSLVEVEESTAVDFGDEDVVVVLALGSDSEGNADAIELIAMNFETGQAAAVGIPRDTVVEFDGEPSKINDGLRRGGAELMATRWPSSPASSRSTSSPPAPPDSRRSWTASVSSR